MKSILLLANEDGGLPARLESALTVARAFGGHISCIQATPFQSFIISDPFGGMYARSTVLAELRSAEEAHQSRIEADLAREAVSWDWQNHDGNPAQILVDRARLADIIIVSLPAHGGSSEVRSTALTADVAVHARAPVLAIPHEGSRFDVRGPAIVAWNGSHECAHALRLALPIIERAAGVQIVTVSEGDIDFPANRAREYLARHGVDAQLHTCRRDSRSVADTLLETSADLGGSCIVMGAYGHSRFREAVLGGVTRDLLNRSNFPLLLSH